MTYHLVLAVLVAGAVAGCAGSGADEATPDAAAGTVAAEPLISATLDPLMDVPETPEAAAVVIARRMFAESLGLSAASVAVESIEEVTWNDGSLGCPQPGMMYTQAIVPGWRITMTDGGSNTAVYHAGEKPGGGTPTVIRCTTPAVAGDAALGGPALEAAKADLKEREGDSEIIVEDSFVAPVASLMCDDQVSSEPAEGPQRLILEYHLRSGATVHVYRSWADEIIYCGTTDDLEVD
jgi:hypothetical protein